jgi:hypothetical protein
MKFIIKTFVNQVNHLFSGSKNINIKFFKMLMVLLITVCFSFSKSYCQKVANLVKGNLIILNAPQQDVEPEANLASHKQFDVEVYRIQFSPPYINGIKQAYSIRYFIINHNNSLDYRKAWITKDDNYDKAKYQWTDENTVAVKIFNSKTAIADTVELFYFEGGSGIRDKRKINFQ